MKYRYVVLNYALTVIEEFGTPCLVLAKKVPTSEKEQLHIYISKRWEPEISERRIEYVSDLISHLLSLPVDDIDHILANAKEFSVGPLRLGLTGTCPEQDLHGLLDEVFIPAGYSVLV